MSACIFIAADCPLPEHKPLHEYSFYINLDTGVVDDGGADDNYYLFPFSDVSIYCEKQYGVCLEWAECTDGRAKQIIDCIRAALTETDSVELWSVWLSGYWEYDDRPVIYKQTARIDELSVADIRKINSADNWNNKNRNRPSFYCMEIVS